MVEDSDTDTDLYYNENELSDDGFYASLDDMGKISCSSRDGM